MTQLFISADFIVNRMIASSRKKMWKSGWESSKSPSISWSWKSKVWGEREAASIYTDNTPHWEDLVSFMDVLQLQEFPYGKQGPAEEYRIPLTNPLGFQVHRLHEWGFPIPKHSRDPRSPKDFESYTKSRQSSCHQWCLMGCCMLLMHQLGIRMTQKWELFFHLWTNSLVYLEVIRHHLTQNIFVKAVHVRFSRIYFEKCSYQTPWKTYILFFFPRFKSTSIHGLKSWISVSELTVFSLPHPTGSLTLTQKQFHILREKGTESFQT